VKTTKETYSEASAWKEIDWNRLTKLNIGKLKSLMKADGVDALFAHHIENFQYVTGYKVPGHMNCVFNILRQGAIILADREQPIMLAGAADIFDARNFWWIDDVRPMPADFDRWPEIIQKTLLDQGFRRGKIAVDPFSPYVLVDRIKQELGDGCTLVSAESILKEARSIKNEEEIKVIRRAAALAGAMVVAAKNATKEGVREIEVAREAEHRLAALEPLAYPAYKTVVSSGDRAAYLDRVASNKIINRGEIVMIDAGCRYEGYYSEFSRHVMVGEPTAEQKKMYATAFEAEQEAIKAIRPEAKASEIDSIARDIIKKANYGEYQHQHYTGHGHGVGLHDPPIIGDPGQQIEYILKPGMVIAIEPGIFKPGVGGVREEDVILVTENGHEILSKVGYEDKLLG
jgi:Xaa-Pro aminopeptidase